MITKTAITDNVDVFEVRRLRSQDDPSGTFIGRLICRDDTWFAAPRASLQVMYKDSQEALREVVRAELRSLLPAR